MIVTPEEARQIEEMKQRLNTLTLENIRLKGALEYWESHCCDESSLKQSHTCSKCQPDDDP